VLEVLGREHAEHESPAEPPDGRVVWYCGVTRHERAFDGCDTLRQIDEETGAWRQRSS